MGKKQSAPRTNDTALDLTGLRDDQTHLDHLDNLPSDGMKAVLFDDFQQKLLMTTLSSNNRAEIH